VESGAVREISARNEIQAYFHCRSCFKEKPPKMAPRDWMHIEAGWTPQGFQVWCVRCECNVVHVDFEGHKHPANTTRAPREPSS
jgi:hypothetical protein